MSEDHWNERFAARHSRRALGGLAAGGLVTIGRSPLAEADPRKRRSRRRKRQPRRPNGRPPLGAPQSGWEFGFEWGTRGSGAGEFSQPLGVAVDDSTFTVYVADTGNDRIQKFSTTGEFLDSWGAPGQRDGQFNHPMGVAVDGARNVFVADSNNQRVQKFTPDGEFVTAWFWQFLTPAGIAVDANGTVFVTDASLNSVQMFTNDGAFIGLFNGLIHGVSLDAPVGIAIGGDAVDGGVYVANEGDERIVEFDERGNVLRQWGEQGRGPGEFGAAFGVALNTALGLTTSVYITDNEYDSVQVFDQRGNWLGEFGENGDKPGEFDSPAGIAVDRDGNVYVADSDNHRIQVFTLA
jgi:DNA-binding beta-propeller fold protein YncE